jgi:hypothetical protein
VPGLRGGRIWGAGLALAALASCAAGDGATLPQAPGAPRFLGVETRLLDADLVNLRVAVAAPADGAVVSRYADCAAAQYALIRGLGFARHVRTTVTEEGGVWRGDAVYTVSSALPDGVRTLDAEVVVQDCETEGIPTV